MSITKVIFHFPIMKIKSFPVGEVQSIFGRFMEKIEAIYIRGRPISQSLVLFYFNVSDPNSIHRVI